MIRAAQAAQRAGKTFSVHVEPTAGKIVAVWRLPGTSPAEEFMRAYWRLVEETNASSQLQPRRPHHGPGSFGALVRDYLASGEFNQLKERTKAEYRRVLEGLADHHGHRLLRDLKRRHVRRLRDERADAPGASNTSSVC